MKLPIQIIAVFIFLIPIFVYAEWYWITVPQDPGTGYFKEQISPKTIGYTDPNQTQVNETQTVLADTFMDTMDLANDSKECDDELDNAIEALRKFDTSHSLYSKETTSCSGNECKSIGDGYTVEAIKGETTILSYKVINEDTIEDRKRLIKSIESNTLKCLEDEQKELEEKQKEIEMAAEEQKHREEIERAIEECDFDFFENDMSNAERMDTWEQRENCKDNSTQVETKEVEKVSSSVEPVQIVSNVTEQIAYRPPSSNNISNTVETEPIFLDKINDSENITEATTTEYKENMEDFEKVVEKTEAGTNQNDIHIESSPQSQVRPSFFKRVINFFVSWFN